MRAETVIRWTTYQTRRVLSVLAVTAASGCTSVFQVTKGGDETPAGLPFYLKKGIYRQHTTYEYAWVRLTLSKTPVVALAKAGSPEQLGTPVVVTREFRDTPAAEAQIDALRRLVLQLSTISSGAVDPTIAKIDETFAAIDRLPADHLRAPAQANLRMTSNYTELVPTVDYSIKYYLNGKIPPFGSNSIAAELAPDGTLSKGSAEVSGGVGDAITAIAGAVTGILPVSAFLTSKWVPTPHESAAFTERELIPEAVRQFGDPETHAFRVSITLEQQAVIFDFTNELPSAGNPITLNPVTANFTNGRFTTRPVGPGAEKPAQDAISFSGSVKLPPIKKP